MEVPLDAATRRSSQAQGKLSIRVNVNSCFHTNNRVCIEQSIEYPDGGDGQVTVAEVWPGDDDIDLYDAALFVHWLEHGPKLLGRCKELAKASGVSIQSVAPEIAEAEMVEVPEVEEV